MIQSGDSRKIFTPTGSQIALRFKYRMLLGKEIHLCVLPVDEREPCRKDKFRDRQLATAIWDSNLE